MKNISIQNLKKYAALIVAFFLLLLAAEDILAQVINNASARRDVRGTSRRTARRVNRRHDYMTGQGYNAPVAAGAAAATTAAILYSLPNGCVMRAISGINYHYCNGHYYQPQYQGTQVVYVQANVKE